MAWRLDGTYFESCSCDTVCPCTWSALTAKATLDRCRALLAYHVDSGEIDGVDVSGLSFALFLDTPPVMAEGNWRVGVYLDDAASDRQAEQQGRHRVVAIVAHDGRRVRQERRQRHGQAWLGQQARNARRRRSHDSDL